MTPAPHSATDASPTPLEARQSRLALRMFFVYLAVYAGYMGLAAFAPGTMSRPVWAGVNLAVLYGLGLILGAVLLAVFYMLACQRLARRDAAERGRP